MRFEASKCDVAYLLFKIFIHHMEASEIIMWKIFPPSLSRIAKKPQTLTRTAKILFITSSTNDDDHWMMIVNVENYFFLQLFASHSLTQICVLMTDQHNHHHHHWEKEKKLSSHDEEKLKLMTMWGSKKKKWKSTSVKISFVFFSSCQK